MTERGIARDGYAVLSPDARKLAPSPPARRALLKKNIALTHLPIEFTAPGTEIGVEIRKPARQSSGGVDAVLQEAKK